MAVYPASDGYKSQPTNWANIAPEWLPVTNFLISGAASNVSFSSRLNYPLTVSGTVGRVVNRAGRAFSFSSSYFDIGQVQANLDRGVNTEFTLIAYVNVLSAGSYPMFISGNNGGTDITELRLFDATGRPEFVNRNASGALPDARAANSIVGIGPVCLIGTYFRGAAKLWQNGVLVASTSGISDAFAFGTHSWRVANRAVSAGFPFNGDLNLAAVLNVGLNDRIAQALSLNPWQIFEDPFASFYYTPSGVGPNIYTITPSGGVVFSGTNTLRRERRFVPSGGLSFSGTVALRRERSFIPSGGVNFGGTAPISFNTPNIYTINPSGGFTFSGTVALRRDRVLIATGGVNFGGTVPLIRTRLLAPTGQVTFAGSAPITFIPAGGLPYVPTARITVGSARSARIS